MIISHHSFVASSGSRAFCRAALKALLSSPTPTRPTGHIACSGLLELKSANRPRPAHRNAGNCLMLIECYAASTSSSRQQQQQIAPYSSGPANRPDVKNNDENRGADGKAHSAGTDQDMRRESPSSSSSSPPATSLIHPEHQFTTVPQEHRNKKAFHDAIGLFLHNNKQRRGQIEFIYAALDNMKAFGLHKDLETYKKLLNIFHKGKMLPTTRLQRNLKHFPVQQDCCVCVLDQMEWYGCQPDKEVYDIVVNLFGVWSFASKKIMRMLYWMPKLKHSNAYLDRRLVEGKDLTASDLAAIALKMICRDPATRIHRWLTDSLESTNNEGTWVLCGFCPLQKLLLDRHPVDQPLYVDGPFRVYVMEHQVNYFTLTADPDPKKYHGDFRLNKTETENDWREWPTRWTSAKGGDQCKQLTVESTMHEQRESTILSCASTGNSSKGSAAAWIQLMQRTLCPRLAELSVVFRLRHANVEVVPFETASSSVTQQ